MPSSFSLYCFNLAASILPGMRLLDDSGEMPPSREGDRYFWAALSDIFRMKRGKTALLPSSAASCSRTHFA
jgi:hypothetical protein